MEVTIASKEEKPLLNRTEVWARLVFEGQTPSRRDVLRALAKALGAKEELVIVRRVLSAYGERAARVLAYVYQSRESLERLEQEAALKKRRAGEKGGGESGAGTNESGEENPGGEAEKEGGAAQGDGKGSGGGE